MCPDYFGSLGLGFVNYYKKEYEPLDWSSATNILTSCYPPGRIWFCTEYRCHPEQSRVALGTSPCGLFLSNFTDFASAVCSHHALASPVTNTNCASLIAGVTQTRPGIANLDMRSRLHTACLNMRTLLCTCSQCISMRTCNDYGIDIACLSEMSLPIARRKHSTRYHSGLGDNSGLHGAANVMNSRVYST